MIKCPFSYEVEADNEDEARELAENADPCDFEYTDWAQEIEIVDVEEDE